MAVPPIGYNDPTIGGLIAWWTFNEGNGTNVYDYSGNNRTATITNSLATPVNTIWTNGIVRNGMFVNTNMLIFSPITFNPTNYSLAFWIRPESVGPSNHNFGPIIEKADGTVGIYWMKGFASIDYYDTTVIQGEKSPLGSVPSNQWTHCVMANLNLYTNGSFSYAFTNSLKTIQLSAIAGDGLADPINIEWLVGTLDDIRIYNRPLSTNEILKLYNGGYGSQK